VTLRRVGFTAVPPGAKPGFDHADTFLDCRKGRYLRAIPDLPGVAGVLIDSAQDLLCTSDRGAARVSIFRASDEHVLGRVGVGPRPNALAHDPERGLVFSFDLGEPAGTNCTASVVSIAEPRLKATIPVPGRPRWAIFDPQTQAVYANIADPAQIAVIDAATLTLREPIAVPAAGPHGLAIVEDDHGGTLWCAADAGVLVVIDRDSRVIVATLPLPGAPDVVMYDRALRRLYVAVGTPGTVSAFDVEGRVELETIATEEGAHTIGWDPPTRQLFVFQPKSCGVAIYEETA
jgi:DNA-binding beta-propeller fold protein YncE